KLAPGLLAVLIGAYAGCSRSGPDAPPPDSPPPSLPAAEVPPGEPWFAEVGRERGLNFVHDAGPTGEFFLPQIVGSGAAFFDFDNDGRLDILLLQNGGPKSKST